MLHQCVCLAIINTLRNPFFGQNMPDETKKVLLVEDETALLYALQAKFRMEGYEVEAVSEGQSAINKLKTFTPDAILLDIMLPRMDGWEVLQQIRADERFENIPVIVISNLTDKHSKERGLELGVKEFLIKSEYDLDELVSKIKNILSGRK